MDAVYKGLNWTTRRVIAVFVVVMVAALLAGGLGGYLIRGVSALAQGTTSVSVTQSHPLSAPFTEPHDSNQAPFPLTEPHDGGR